MSDTKRYNPFKPNHPVHTGMFVGRVAEIERCDSLLCKLKSGNPTNILVVGERGIGKTSLLLFINHIAKGNIQWHEPDAYNYLTIQFNIDENIDQLGLIKKINRTLNRQLSKEEAAIAFMKKTWEFLQRIEIAESRIRSRVNSHDAGEVFDQFVYSLTDTVKTFTNDSILKEIGLHTKKEGIIILIDEADKASPSLQLGSFLKNLSESLAIEGCDKIQFVLSGLPKVREALSSSHRSSLRLFEEMELFPLVPEDIALLYEKGLNEVNEKVGSVKYSIPPETMQLMVDVSEGYPHFIQQIGYSTFDLNTDDEITKETAYRAIFNQGGAIDLIGDRYYRDMYYNRIKEDSYREILQIMAEKPGQWVTRQEILARFSKTNQILDNGIKALKSRNIILSKPGIRGVYKLQWIGFGMWIKLFTSRGNNNAE